MPRLIWTCIGLFLVALEQAQSALEGYSYYSTGVEPLSDTCKAALNNEIDCDSSLEEICWNNVKPTSENLKSICTQRCYDSLAATRETVESSCASDHIIVAVENKKYPVTHTIDGYIGIKDKICLRDA